MKYISCISRPFHWTILWITLLYTCISVAQSSCGLPPRLQNGMLKPEFTNQEIFSIGSKVQYVCQPGYVRIPGSKSTLICMENSKWSPGPEEFCKRKSCRSPVDIENGYYDVSDSLFFGSKLTYYCNKGYRMISKINFQECLADGTWSGDLPVCEAVLCPPPEPILGGRFEPVKEEYAYLEAVIYSCNDPNIFILTEKSIFCMDNGTWSSSPPECIAVNCFPPFVPYSRKLSGFSGPYKLNYVVQFECENGFILKGSSTVKCSMGSKWEPPLPECLRTYCTEPKLIDGYISSGTPKFFRDGAEKGYNVDDTLKLSCDRFRTLKGSKTITCGSDLKWHPEVPICEN
ncbi:complement receptor type 1-like isoform X2 [Spea bombifrons]|nr:complement receptor type 1-like isoform X2 [Spea bombifrons]